jgi:hypothetical protein
MKSCLRSESCYFCSRLVAVSAAGVTPAGQPPGRQGYAYTFSIFTKKPLNSGVKAFGSITVGVS